MYYKRVCPGINPDFRITLDLGSVTEQRRLSMLLYHYYCTRKGLSAALIALFFVVFPAVSSADSVPPLINYQGRLTDHAGAPVNDTIEMTFSLYDGEAGQPEVVDEEIVLAGTAGVSLAHDNLSAGGSTVTNTDDDTTYDEGIDYWLNLADGKIGRIAQSSIADGQTVLVDYSFIADQLWTETHANILVNRGIYNVLLGSVNPLNGGYLSGDSIYLGVTIGGEELLPRQRITSVAFALKAGEAHTIGGKTAAELGTVREIQAGLGLAVGNPNGPTVTILQEFQADPVTNAPYGLIPPNSAYPEGNVFYLDYANGDDNNDGLSYETAFKTWERLFNTGSGALDQVQGPVKVFVYPPADPDEPVSLTRAVQRNDCAIVGVGYPVITGPLCAMTFCGRNGIVAGFRVYHPNGNGIHVTPNLNGTRIPTGTIVVGNIFLDGGVGGSVAVDVSDVLVAYNRIGGTNFGVHAGSSTTMVKGIKICHNTILGAWGSAIYFRRAEKCISHDNRVAFSRKTVTFGTLSNNCRSLNDLGDLGAAGFEDLGTDNMYWTPQ